MIKNWAFFCSLFYTLCFLNKLLLTVNGNMFGLAAICSVKYLVDRKYCAWVWSKWCLIFHSTIQSVDFFKACCGDSQIPGVLVIIMFSSCLIVHLLVESLHALVSFYMLWFFVVFFFGFEPFQYLLLGQLPSCINVWLINAWFFLLRVHTLKYCLKWL